MFIFWYLEKFTIPIKVTRLKNCTQTKYLFKHKYLFNKVFIFCEKSLFTVVPASKCNIAVFKNESCENLFILDKKYFKNYYKSFPNFSDKIYEASDFHYEFCCHNYLSMIKVLPRIIDAFRCATWTTGYWSFTHVPALQHVFHLMTVKKVKSTLETEISWFHKEQVRL